MITDPPRCASDEGSKGRRPRLDLLDIGLYVCRSLCYKNVEVFGPSRFAVLYDSMIGEKLGKYTILETVGSGSMGTVYKAEDPEGRLVALKLIRSQVLYDADKRERFLQGILAASEIRHRGVCPIVEIGDDNDDFFVVMPFLKGKTLDHYRERRPLPWQQALDIASAAGAALAAIHEAGTAHRGLKPGNIWIFNDMTVLISDCCIARFTEMAKRGRVRLSLPGVGFADTLIPLGALAYMSPEQVRGEPVDYRSDIFSFGVILYEMLSGRHPFEARNSLSRITAILEADPPPLTSKLMAIPVELQSIVRKALAKAPDDRHQSVNALLADLASVRSRSSAHSIQVGYPTSLRNLLLARFLALAAIVLAAFALLIYSLMRR